MPWGRLILAAFLTLLTATCVGSGAAMVALPELTRSFSSMSAPGLSSAEDAAAREPYQTLVAGNLDELATQMAAPEKRGAAIEQLTKMRALASTGKPLSSRLLTWAQNISTAGRSMRTVHEYTYADRVVRVTTSLEPANGGGWRAIGFNVNAITAKEADANKFSLSGHSPLYFGFLAGAVIVPIFMLVTAIAALFWPNLKMRPVWIFPIFIGLGTFRMNGATEAIMFQPVSFQLFGASATWSGSGFEPWMFGLSIPVAALVFWIMRAVARVRRPATPTAG